ncbi:UNVERIFIED_CONTAM: hypothetical protein HHA_237540 [Hammondia hammondi]|eukprot:XP_008885401.1 hypothetical protein HHA_237540 [Hammondia hammondi]
MQRKNHLFLHAIEFVASVDACGSALAVRPEIHPPNYCMRNMDVSVESSDLYHFPVERQPFVPVSLTQEGACPRNGTLRVWSHAPVLCWPQVADAGLFIYPRFFRTRTWPCSFCFMLLCLPRRQNLLRPFHRQCRARFGSLPTREAR